ncbi:helix-turn-helix domain-containing protein [Nocardia carnea]|uniref:helix-turn-helix domain-containing protein n=1 Tax=Nocardia carnea TaxID=37328 RepID=UPI0024583582|nr:helix-turn-helix domain-containing protein [Nocardia carnea]
MNPELVQGIGANVRAFRKAAGVTQAELSSAIGKSLPWIKSIEQGRSSTDRLTDLINIATVLKVELPDLLGRPVDSLAPGYAPRRDIVDAVRDAVLRTASPITGPNAEIVELETLSDRVAGAWTIWHNSPTAHRVLGGLLPDLILDSTTAYFASDNRRRAAATMAGTWHVTRQWLHHIPDGDLAWVVAERAMNAAREADDPHLIALGAWALSASYRRAGQQEEATRLCLHAADEVKKRIDASPKERRDLMADYGMLHLAASISAAQSDEDGRAWALHRVADDTARALGADIDPWTMFGRGNVDIHGLALQAELGRPDAIVEYSRRLDLDTVPSVERRSRAMIDTARGLTRRGEDEGAVLVLLDAEAVSADEVHHSPLVGEMLRELINRDNARARAHVQGLAKRCGVIR